MIETELKSLIKRSPEKARKTIFEQYCNYVYAIVISKLRNCGSREDMEECVSDIFADIFKGLDNEKNLKGDIKAFIAMIAKRRTIDTYRRLNRSKQATVSIDDESMNDISSPENIETNAEQSEQNSLLLQKINELGEPDSTIIIQKYYYNRSFKEIAKVLSMKADAVQKRSIRAREKLKIKLTEVGISI